MIGRMGCSFREDDSIKYYFKIASNITDDGCYVELFPYNFCGPTKIVKFSIEDILDCSFYQSEGEWINAARRQKKPQRQNVGAEAQIIKVSTRIIQCRS